MVVKGQVHRISSNVTAFELGDGGGENALIFIGGLGDGLLTVPYVERLTLPQGWCVYNLLFSSSYTGWGLGSLDRDVEEMALLVQYLKSDKKGKIVLMGHSTGTQDCIHYLLTNGKDVDGVILQASVSDREAMEMSMGHEELGRINEAILKLQEAHGAEYIIPREYSDKFFGAPMTCYRWLSMSLKGGDDDYFSSDLSDEQLRSTFGKVDKPLAFLYSGDDEFVPSTVDKQSLVEHWSSFVPSQYLSKESKVVPGATHNCGSKSKPESFSVLNESVSNFLSSI
ncbi:unnamed protein product [Cyberlindnera jadinii]|uniref:DUF1749-domain-containing protein n=1 Tax=Cyberlindnera jadinii (strain ATCC 18201 / CBS 1600 / BCRC 20928 / JCM 3617 / NBRC 0987 / NRRL Y-1542) TaxID=983966 RepID=A0A0H5C4Z2_CYBJN|nr:unnamed protein product [Cyberlindnera jadinii]